MNSVQKDKKKGKPSNSKSGSTPAFTVEMAFEGGSVKVLDAASLDLEESNDIVEQANGKKFTGKTVTLRASGLADWPTGIAANCFRLWKALIGEGQRTVKLKAEGQERNGPLEVAGDILRNKTISAEGTCRALELVAEALVICCKPEDINIHADAVIERVRTQGFTSDYCRKLRSNLKQRLNAKAPKSGTDTVSNEGISSYTLARLFLEKHYSLEGDGFLFQGLRILFR